MIIMIWFAGNDYNDGYFEIEAKTWTNYAIKTESRTNKTSSSSDSQRQQQQKWHHRHTHTREMQEIKLEKERLRIEEAGKSCLRQ